MNDAPQPMQADSLPPDTSLGPVRLAVSDLDRSLAWYGSVLGLETLSPLEADPGDSGAERRETLGVAGGQGAQDQPVQNQGVSGTPLVHLEEHPGVRPVSPRSRLGLFHFAILLPERADLGRLVRHLTEMDVPFGAADHAVSEALYLQDPDGLGVEVYVDRPRDQWRFRGDELVMTTEPLDLADLEQTGTGGRWRSIPAGSVMGHIHLHTGDLERANTFYHGHLGFDRMVWSYPGALFLSAGGYHHHLGLNTWARDASPAGPGDARLIEWEVRVPGTLEALLARLERAGCRVQRTADGGRAEDPWGTAVRFRG